MSLRRVIAATLVLSLATAAKAQRRDSVTIPLPGARKLHGFVADNAERPLDSAEVYVESLKRTAFTARDGSFRFEDVKSGKYELRARKLGYYPQVRWVTVGDEGGATAFWLLSRGPIGLPTVVTSAVRGGLSGVIGDTAYKVLPGATISVIAGDRRTESDSTGSFFIDLKPGKHMIRVTREGYGSKLLSVTLPRDSGRRVQIFLGPARGSRAREEQAVLEMEMRITRANPVWSELFTRDDIAKMGKKDLREIAQAGAGAPVNDTCSALIDGSFRVPVWALDADDIDIVEVYTPRPPRQVQTSIMRGPQRAPPRPRCPAVFAWLRK